ncbi:TadE/TadG family type IV pilus assembly protein [Methylobacterium sp. 17Sr1-1]|uniref:TadE/TadG family type IV pilus assembly protein n=1 Tax=Methylobacterium sp. 17Sr1-1 TaxID=2202826 RepID=UPI000D6F3865|nr:TadE/TadG family type IV pilus assembly protein [Methylobacterium sp. 17Sr1-1]AWN52953.1 pilus assembly protein TadE [Methylobacterium sp. 17Sr1-1]
MRCVRDLIRDEKGATAVEFGLVGLLFIAILVGTMTVAQILYFGQKLDYATEQASRQVLIGTTQRTSTASLASFTQALCGFLPAAMSCSDVIVNLYVVPAANPGYYAYAKSDMSGLALPVLTPGSGQFSLGNRGDYQYLQVIYPITLLPPFVTGWLDATTTYKGKAAYLLISTAAFRVEQY